jgi:hypothetical protein
MRVSARIAGSSLIWLPKYIRPAAVKSSQHQHKFSTIIVQNIKRLRSSASRILSLRETEAILVVGARD